MNFDWADYLAVANGWLATAATDPHPQAVYRSIVSRAYYAAFHATEELAQELGMDSTQSASEHYRVRRFFENRGRTARQLSFHLRDLYDLRIGADYIRDISTLYRPDIPSATQRAIATAVRIIGTVEHLRQKGQ